MNTTTITSNVDMNLDAVENILLSTAKRCLKIKIPKKRRSKISSNKKWFDKECRYKRHELQKLANQKHRNPLSNTLREEYHNVLKQYKNLLKHRRNEYYSNKICELENTVENSNNKSFWNCLKSIDDTLKETYTPPISEGKWMSHFQSLHLNESLNEHQEAIIDKLQNAEDITTRAHSLDYLITENKIRIAARKLKNNKSSFSDKIKNEMIKFSLNELMPVSLKLFNTIFDLGIMPQTWCDGLITPIFKCGTKRDLSNSVEFVFPVVLENYVAQFSIRDFLNTLTYIPVIYFTSLKLVF